jgi:hypothetical protein
VTARADSIHLRVSGLAARVGAALALASSLAACVDPDGSSSGPPIEYEPEDVAQVVIDSGGALELDPGEGVGVIVEYAGDGLWQITTSCDTLITDEVCSFDVLVTGDESGSELGDVQGVGLESEDLAFSPDPLAVELQFVTEEDLDGVTFEASPGASLRISALLYEPLIDSRFNWTDDPRLLSWVGHGAVNQGAPTNPVDLSPDQP